MYSRLKTATSIINDLTVVIVVSSRFNFVVIRRTFTKFIIFYPRNSGVNNVKIVGVVGNYLEECRFSDTGCLMLIKCYFGASVFELTYELL